MNRFVKFIHSPYFNINDKVSDLTDYLAKTIKQQEEPISKAKLWTDILKEDQPYNDLKFRKICNDVLERFERFLTIEQLDKDNLLQVNLLLESIKQNKFELLVDKQTKKSNRYLNREIEQSSDYFLQKYYFTKNLQTLKSDYERNASIKYSASKDLHNDLSTNLDAFYVIEKLRYAADLLTWQKLYKSDTEVDLDEVLDMIKTKGLGSIPAVQFYHLMYLLMSNNAEQKEYIALKTLAENEIDIFQKGEQREVIDVLLSYVIKDVNKGDLKAVAEMLDLYDWGIQSDIILENGFLSPTTFRNYVVGGLRLSEFEKIESFISNNASLLKDSQRENAVNFCQARVAFHKKAYNEVLTYLNLVNYDDIWYNVNSRYYLLASYYELDEMDVLDSAIASFLVFLRREKSIKAERKTKQISFAKYLKKLVAIRHLKPEVIKLKEKIEEDDKVFNKSWLLDKVGELV